MFGSSGTPGGTSALRFSRTRGRIQGGSIQGVNYPSPFFDVAHTYLPTTVKQMFRWCRYYFLTNPLINSVIYKLSEYPVTDIIIDHKDKRVANRWMEYFNDQLRYRSYQIEFGLDYHTYGNGFASIGYPFTKYLRCVACEFQAPAKKIRANWQLTNYAFRMTCPRCGNVGDAIAKDYYYKDASGIKMVRWNPEDIEITYNDITGEYSHFYTVPATVRNDIVIGKKDVVEDIPQIFIQALKEQKGIIFSKQNLFHMRRPTLATQDRGWGIPLLLPVLKDVFYLQIMKKAQEAILLEHIVPLRILFPQAGSGTSDPYVSINLVEWREHVAAEISRWRYDNNYIPIMPLPLGNQTIGGDGRALMLTQEIQVWAEQILNGMTVPLEFIKGGMSYAGTNVSMRMLENQFLGYILRHKAMANWMMQEVSSFLGWPMANIRFQPFKMADDLQRKAYNFQLNQANKLSDTTLLMDAGYSQDQENEIMAKETAARTEATKKQQLAMAEMQGEAQLIMSKYQIKAQQAAQQEMQAGAAPGEPGGQDAMGQGTPGGQEAGQNPSQQAPAPTEAGQGGQQQPEGAPQGMQAMQSPLGMGNRMQEGQAGAVDLPTMAYMSAQTIASMPPDQQQMAVQNLYSQSPELGDLVVQILKSMGVNASPGGQQQQTNGVQVDTRPLPEQLPPRRENPVI